MTRAQTSLDFALPPERIATLEHDGGARIAVFVLRADDAVGVLVTGGDGAAQMRLTVRRARWVGLRSAIEMAFRRLDGEA